MRWSVSPVLLLGLESLIEWLRHDSAVWFQFGSHNKRCDESVPGQPSGAVHPAGSAQSGARGRNHLLYSGFEE